MRGSWRTLAMASLSLVAFAPASAADLIVSAQDGKFVRVEGRATFPDSPPPDSLVVLDGSRFPPVVKVTIESGIEHTVQGPPQAVAITPDGKLAIVAAPTRYDYAAKKELFDNFVQIVDLEASPPVVARVEVGAHANGLTINRAGTLLLAAAHDGTVKVLTIEGKSVRLASQVKVGEKRLSGIQFMPDGRSAIVALRDENGAAVLAIDGTTVTLTSERVATGVNPYAIDVSSDGKWAVIGNTGVNRTVDDADVVTLVDVAKRPFRAAQQISVASTPEGVAISPDGRWIAVSSMAGSNLLAADPGRHKLGKVALYEIREGGVVKINELPGGEAAQGVVFTQDSATVIVQFDVERALALYAIRDGRLVDTGERIRLAAGPVSIRSMPR
ncbi:MAG: PD40 domain-containing protein [Rhizobacter sp.]|nr:PD40 domain-containing protein [Rhizobacter sp.]